MKWVFLLCLFFGNRVIAQNTIGTPNIINYPKQAYHAGNQNWAITQDANGIMYVANNSGLLTFDGAYWRLYELPNKTIVRSVCIALDGKVYVGGQQEMGYFIPNATGELQYHSLKPLLPAAYQDFADIWNICMYQQSVFFRSNKILFQLSGNRFTAYEGTNWRFLAATQTGLLAYEFTRGLVHFTNNRWVPFPHQSALPPNVYIRAAIDLPNQGLLLATFEDGVFHLQNDSLTRFVTDDITAIASKKIYGCCRVASDKLGFITNLSGCMITDTAGNLVQQISRKEGIQNNNVLSIFLDREQNLWLGLDNGLDLVTYNNAIKNIFPDGTDKNTGYASAIYHNRLYMGSATGVSSIPLNSTTRDLSFTRGVFSPVANTTGRVWSLAVVDDQLLVGHNAGGYRIAGNTAILVDSKTGVWGFQKLNPSNPSSPVIAGSYAGIDFYTVQAGKMAAVPYRVSFESARFITKQANTLLIAHPYKGLYQLQLSTTDTPVVSRYLQANSFLSPNHNYLYSIKGKTILATDKGIYEYQPATKTFAPSAFLQRLFKHQAIDYLKEDCYGNIWFSESNRLGVVDMSSKPPVLVYFPELDGKIMASGFENVNVIDSNNVIIAGEQGFFHVNYAQYRKQKRVPQVLIRKAALLEGDSLLFGGYIPQSTTSKIQWHYNSLHFEFASTQYSQTDNTTFSFYLEGFDKQWSDWAKRNQKDYTNLPAGSYTFYVKSRNTVGNESPEAAWSFTVLPPWYQTSWAYAFYTLLFAAGVYGVHKWQQRKYIRRQQGKLAEQQRQYAEEQRQQEFQHQLTVRESEKKIIQLNNEKLQAEIELEKNERELTNLRNEKLQTEIEHKNSELATSAMGLVRKMEVLARLKDDLNQYKTSAASEKQPKELKKITRLIDEELSHNQEWEQFAIHFDSVHTNYLKKLKDLYPDLTASELKLSAYLRLNLSTKEIAQLMNISIRGVETSRYRLRKKMSLDNETNLFDHLITVTK